MKKEKAERHQSRYYFGRVITPGNRRQVENSLIAYFITVESKQEHYKDFTNDQILQGAEIYARYEVRREQKHLKAFLSGKKTYTYKDRKYNVVDKEGTPVMHSQIQEFLNGDKEEE